MFHIGMTAATEDVLVLLIQEVAKICTKHKCTTMTKSFIAEALTKNEDLRTFFANVQIPRLDADTYISSIFTK